MNLIIDCKEFDRKLLGWWKRNKRTYPWRNTSDPYKVITSEVLLHRTKADNVHPVYVAFIKKYPTLKDAVNASPEELSRAIHRLGLRWRAKLLYAMTAKIMDEYGGKIPSGDDDLKSLPGVGDYIASAVRCFAFGYPEVLLDTNTVRILGRIFGLRTADGSRRSGFFMERYRFILDKEHPREFNYAMIDLGALVCAPRKPLCGVCPVNKMCSYYVMIRAANE